MDNLKVKPDVRELLLPGITKNCSKFLEITETIDSSMPSRDAALIVKKALGSQKDPVLSFLLKKTFRLAAFKLKGTRFKISLAGLQKLLSSPDRLDDLALAICSIDKVDAYLASDYFKSANWKEFPTEILPCFCFFFKNYGNSQDLDDLLELTRNPNAIVVAAALEAIKKLDTGSLRSVIQPLIQNANSYQDSKEALELLYVENANHDSSNLSKADKSYYLENHQLLVDSLKNGTSELETIRIIRLIKRHGSIEDAEYVKPFLKNSKPDIVRAAMKTLEVLDKEYLCVYLPQLLQDKSAKVRLTATKVFQNIDKDSVVSIVLSMLGSLNQNQRTIAITTAMLVDFNQIRDEFIRAFAMETNSELLEKIGLVLMANPDSELVKDMYIAHKRSKTILKAQREKLIETVAEKVSFAFNNKFWAKELLLEAEAAYKALPEDEAKTPLPSAREAAKQAVEKQAALASNIAKPLTTSNPLIAKPKSVPLKPSDIKEEPKNNNANGRIPLLDMIHWYDFSSKLKMRLIFVFTIMLVWGILLAVVILRAFD